MRLRACLAALAALAALFAGCATPRVLRPEGPAAAHLEELFWIFVVFTLAPAALVIALLLHAVLRRRSPAPARAGRWVAIGAGLSGAILFGLLVASVRVGSIVAAPAGPPALTIDVRGHQFWWEVRYPDHGVVTANEIHVPAGVPVRLRLTSADVVHNFWVPELHGKQDMTPGHLNVFWMQADRPGVFRGLCAEFCGIQHALMAFVVVAEEPSSFEAWLAAQGEPARPPEEPLLERGLEVYGEAGCGHCHAIRGITPPRRTDQAGPDLTHLASRRTLGAATMENGRGNLAGWILGPHERKPGVRMPPSTLHPEDLRALLAYLESLR